MTKTAAKLAKIARCERYSNRLRGRRLMDSTAKLKDGAIDHFVCAACMMVAGGCLCQPSGVECGCGLCDAVPKVRAYGSKLPSMAANKSPGGAGFAVRFACCRTARRSPELGDRRV